jgi:hypothetical protein
LSNYAPACYPARMAGAKIGMTTREPLLRV